MKVMSKSKYYNYRDNRPFNRELDSCDVSDWGELYGKCQCAWHPKGFKIFLPPNQLNVCDEYMESDPYMVEQNINSDFHRGRTELTIQLLHKVVSYIGSKPRILDLGCGEGHITEAMRQSMEHGEFTGLDYSLSAIEYANNHFPDIDFSVGDALNAPYTSDYFDVVVCNNLWEHIPDPLNLLTKIKLLLRPGGYIIMSTPSRYRMGNLLRALIGKPVVLMSKYHITEYTVGQVIEQLEWGNFQVEMILSKSISTGYLNGILSKLVTFWTSFVGSQHQIEPTVFYLAKNRC